MKWKFFLTLAFLTFFLVSPLLAQKKVPRDKDGDLSDVTVAALNKETTPLSEIDVEIFVKFLEGLHEQLLANWDNPRRDPNKEEWIVAINLMETYQISETRLQYLLEKINSNYQYLQREKPMDTKKKPFLIASEEEIQLILTNQIKIFDSKKNFYLLTEKWKENLKKKQGKSNAPRAKGKKS